MVSNYPLRFWLVRGDSFYNSFLVFHVYSFTLETSTKTSLLFFHLSVMALHIAKSLADKQIQIKFGDKREQHLLYVENFDGNFQPNVN